MATKLERDQNNQEPFSHPFRDAGKPTEETFDQPKAVEGFILQNRVAAFNLVAGPERPWKNENPEQPAKTK